MSITVRTTVPTAVRAILCSSAWYSSTPSARQRDIWPGETAYRRPAGTARTMLVPRCPRTVIR